MSIKVLQVLIVFYLYRHSVVFKSMRKDAVGSIRQKEDTKCLHKLRNRYFREEGKSKNCLILKGDFLYFKKFYRNLFDDNAIRVLIIGFRTLERVLYCAIFRASISAYAVTIIALKGKSYSVSTNFSAYFINKVKSLLTDTFIAYWSRLKVLA